MFNSIPGLYSLDASNEKCIQTLPNAHLGTHSPRLTTTDLNQSNLIICQRETFYYLKHRANFFPLIEGTFRSTGNWNLRFILCIYFYYQLILIIHGFHICEFTHLLKLMCNLKINISLTFTVTHGYASSGEKLSHLLHTFPAEVKQGQALLSCFRSLQTNVPFTIYLVLYFLQFYAFCWWSHCLKWSQAECWYTA